MFFNTVILPRIRGEMKKLKKEGGRKDKKKAMGIREREDYLSLCKIAMDSMRDFQVMKSNFDEML